MKSRLLLPVLMAGFGLVLLLAAFSQAVRAELASGVSGNPQGILPESAEIEVEADAARGTSSGLPMNTVVNGNIVTNTTWTSAGSPYIVQYSIKIQNGATLIIEPGVEVRLGHEWNGSDYIEVQSGGRLLAQGTATQPITITSEYVTPAKGDWGYIRVLSGGSARFSHCDIGYGGYQLQAPLQVRSGDVQVRDCRIHDNKGRGIQFEATGTGPVLENTLLENNNSYAVAQNVNSAPTYLNLKASGNGTDAILILAGLGNVSGGVHWDFSGAGLPVHVEGSLGIDPGSFLSLGPGTQLYFSEDRFVRVDGALYALGTPTAPITLTGLVEQQGYWIGVDVRTTGAAILRNVNIEYGGGSTIAGGNFYGGFILKLWSSQVVVENSHIYSSTMDGIGIWGGQPVIRYNHIYDNFDSGLRNYTGTTIDARYNWWGDPSGPWHQTINPTGMGDRVRGPVLLDPWLESPPQGDTTRDSLLILQTGGPNRAYPGQTQDYAVSYGNFLTQTIESAVVTMVLPDGAQYMDATGGGIYWPEKNEVFWKLGDVPPEGRGAMSVRVGYDWGLPDGHEDGVMAILGGTNLTESKLNVDPYLAYIPVEVLVDNPLTGGELNGELEAYPDLNTIYDEATGSGFHLLGASHLTLSVGEPVTQVVLIDPDQEAAMFLQRQGAQVLASTYDSMNQSYAVRDATGGMTMTAGLWTTEYWGSWSTGGQGLDSTASISPEKCFANCLIKDVSIKLITKRIKFIGHILKSVDCAKWINSNFEDELAKAKCMLVIKNAPGVGDLISVLDCSTKCRDNPNGYQCTEDYVTCTHDFWDIKCWFGDCEKRVSCQDGYYFLEPVSVNCGFLELGKKIKCIEGIGCVACGSDCPSPQEQPQTPLGPVDACETICKNGSTCSSSSTRISVPHDPNAKYAPEGDLLPGQVITYTITYENEGDGQAYGVYILDQLDEALDFKSVTVQGGGQLLGQSGILIWQIGELGPKGQPGSSGVVTFTARLKEDLPGGTVISNQATVYFPSVGEETPTNMVVNVVQPVVAVPQVVETTYAQPVTITLQGLEVSGLPLTYTVVTSPGRGELSGEGASLIYTPTANFVGEDGFIFKVDNGTMESRPSGVRIIVQPSSADITAPEVVWTNPADGAVNVGISIDPVLTDTEGSAYAPALIVQFSEPISSTTVATDTLTLNEVGGDQVTTSVWYDGMLNRTIIVPREALAPKTQYTGTVTQGIKDASGNPLASAYTWSFQTGGIASQEWRTYLPFMVK